MNPTDTDENPPPPGSSDAPASSPPTPNSGRMPGESVADFYRRRGIKVLPYSGKSFVIPVGKRPSQP